MRPPSRTSRARIRLRTTKSSSTRCGGRYDVELVDGLVGDVLAPSGRAPSAAVHEQPVVLVAEQRVEAVSGLVRSERDCEVVGEHVDERAEREPALLLVSVEQAAYVVVGRAAADDLVERGQPLRDVGDDGDQTAQALHRIGEGGDAPDLGPVE